MKKRKSTLLRLGLVLKGVNGVLELVGGLLLAVLPHQAVTQAILAIARWETGPSIRDWILRGITDGMEKLAAESTFAIFYLLSHGAIKVFLATALLCNLGWAYPVALAVFGLLACYETALFILHPTIPMDVIIAVDLAVLSLIASHWRSERIPRRSSSH